MSYRIECNPESYEIIIKDSDGHVVHHSHTVQQQRAALAFALQELAELKARLPKYADTGETFIPWDEPYFFYLTVSDTVQSPIDPENAFLIAWDDGFWNEFMYYNRAAAEQAAREAGEEK